MKKVLLILLSFVLCLSMVACSNPDNNQSESNEIELTVENICDYIAFDIKLENISRWNSISQTGEEKSGFDKCDIKMDVFAKKPVYLADVKITFDLVATNDEYTPVADIEVQLKYDGSAAYTSKYSCNVEGANPEFKVVIKEVTGIAIKK